MPAVTAKALCCCFLSSIFLYYAYYSNKILYTGGPLLKAILHDRAEKTQILPFNVNGNFRIKICVRAFIVTFTK